jgi:hypothetical protein
VYAGSTLQNAAPIIAATYAAPVNPVRDPPGTFRYPRTFPAR